MTLPLSETVEPLHWTVVNLLQQHYMMIIPPSGIVGPLSWSVVWPLHLLVVENCWCNGMQAHLPLSKTVGPLWSYHFLQKWPWSPNKVSPLLQKRDTSDRLKGHFFFQWYKKVVINPLQQGSWATFQESGGWCYSSWETHVLSAIFFSGTTVFRSGTTVANHS